MSVTFSAVSLWICVLCFLLSRQYVKGTSYRYNSVEEGKNFLFGNDFCIVNIIQIYCAFKALLITGFSKDSAIRNGHGFNIPVVSGCHRIASGTAKHGKIKSHDGYPSAAYSPGYKCRTVINVPAGYKAEVSVGAMNGHKNASSIRPWDFIILVDGSVAGKLDFICEVERYKQLGNSTNKLEEKDYS